MKILTVIGARPQFIKAAILSSEFINAKIEEVIIHTGQHYDSKMSDIFFNELGIPLPKYNLSIGSLSHGKQTGRMLEGIEEILLLEKPDALLVYGDTNSTLAGALAASKLLIPVIHVEAGLRSFNKYMPEEQNRIMVDHISSLLFCPTITAINNLKNENIINGAFYTGDIMFDAVIKNIEIASKRFTLDSILKNINFINNNFLSIEEKEYYLATIHRAENTNDLKKLTTIFESFEKLKKKVLFPIHPRTLKIIRELNLSFNNVVLIEPVGYLEMLYLTKNAYMVLTDSGGLQKEAYFLNTLCTTLRNETEWIETLIDNKNMLASIDIDDITTKACRKVDSISKNTSPFGDGCSGKKIVEIISKHINEVKK